MLLLATVLLAAARTAASVFVVVLVVHCCRCCLISILLLFVAVVVLKLLLPSLVSWSSLELRLQPSLSVHLLHMRLSLVCLVAQKPQNSKSQPPKNRRS